MVKVKKNIINIPANLELLYCNKKWIIVVLGETKTTSLKLEVKVKVNRIKRYIEVSSDPVNEISNIKKKKIKTTQGTTIALIKHLILEASGNFYRYMKFVGIGYRAFPIEGFNDKLFMFKLGYSHFIYFKIPNNYSMTSIKFTNIILSGKSYQNLCQIASIIRLCRKPDKYKGKGILFRDEKIKLKVGKKI